ncbi:unnamed protein product [Ectocarpus sp. CCAP 1310/34]|nr:unnamed protein product [Ectocarpus sp. CCAP 1310/34]
MEAFGGTEGPLPHAEAEPRTQVTSETDVTRALDLARAEFGSTPFVAVNCAGIGYAKRTISRCVVRLGCSMWYAWRITKKQVA